MGNQAVSCLSHHKILQDYSITMLSQLDIALVKWLAKSLDLVSVDASFSKLMLNILLTLGPEMDR
jgi:hypothetical protein